MLEYSPPPPSPEIPQQELLSFHTNYLAVVTRYGKKPPYISSTSGSREHTMVIPNVYIRSRNPELFENLQLDLAGDVYFSILDESDADDDLRASTTLQLRPGVGPKWMSFYVYEDSEGRLQHLREPCYQEGEIFPDLSEENLTLQDKVAETLRELFTEPIPLNDFERLKDLLLLAAQHEEGAAT